MTVINGEISNQLGAKLDGTVWLAAAYHRPVDNVLVLADWAATPLEDSTFSTDAIPGPARLRVEAGSVFAEWDIVVPDEGPVEVTSLMQDSIDYPEPVILAAQAAATRATQEANRAEAGAARVGSAEVVLDARDQATVAATTATGAAATATDQADRATTEADRATEQASAASSSATDANASATVAGGHAQAAQADAVATAADRAQTGEDRTATGEDRTAAASSATAAEGSASAATQSASGAAGSASAAAASASAAAQSEGVAATAATDAADGVRSELSGLVSTASGHADDAADSAAAAAQSAQDAASVVSDGVPDASTTMKGKVKLAGDLAGTADSPTVPGLAGKANTSHTHAVADVTGLQSALDGKVSATSTGTRLYGTTSGGSQTQVQYANGATANTVAYRGTGATLPVGEPTDSDHATTKNYVDTTVSSKADTTAMNARPALFSGAGAAPSTIDGAVVGDWWLNTTTMELSKITGV
ncbi:MAG: hypothetical protein ACLT2I_02675 [Corynebacterium variabile]